MQHSTVPGRVSPSGLIDTGMPDHQLIYCTRKTSRSRKNYSPEVYEEALRKINFPNYELFDDIHKAYENFIQKVMAVIDNLPPSKSKRVKGTSKDRFGAEIMENIIEGKKLFKKFKKSYLHVHKDNYKEVRNEVHKLIPTRQKTYFEKKLMGKIGKPAEYFQY